MDAKAIIDGCFLFKTIDPPGRIVLARLAEPCDFAIGERLINEGDEGDCFYLIVTGQIQVSTMRDGNLTPLSNLGPNSIVGEVALLTGGPRTATVIAMTETTAMRFPEKALHDVIDNYPKAKELMARMLIYRAKDTIVKLAQASADVN